MVLVSIALSVGTLGYMYHMWLRLQPSADQMPMRLFVLYLPAKTITCMAPQLITRGFNDYQTNVRCHARLIRR
jgi:hypothetical protein